MFLKIIKFFRFFFYITNDFITVARYFTQICHGNGTVCRVCSPFGYPDSTRRQQNKTLVCDAMYVTLASENNKNRIV